MILDYLRYSEYLYGGSDGGYGDSGDGMPSIEEMIAQAEAWGFNIRGSTGEQAPENQVASCLFSLPNYWIRVRKHNIHGMMQEASKII